MIIVLIAIDVAATPAIVRANGRSTAAWKNPVIAKMKNIGFRVISTDASTIRPDEVDEHPGALLGAGLRAIG